MLSSSLHKNAGIKLHKGRFVREITRNKKGKANGIVLDDGTSIEVDLVFVNAGVKPATKFFLERNESGIKTDQDGAIACDLFL